jgi:ABC-type dipeptide/oligopeptide/nickel transport system permease subunit
MKISNKLFFTLFVYAFFCITPHSSYSNSHSDLSPTTVTVISAFCTGSVLGTFWGYVDKVVPSSLRYLTTFPAAFALRVVLVNTISEALKKEAIAHETGNLFLASWLWEWIVYKNIAD